MVSNFFIKRDCLEKSDAIVVLSGNGWERTRFGIEIYKQGWAPLFVVIGSTGTQPSHKMARLAIENGIPKEKIIIENESRNTRENMENTVSMARERGWKKIILITSIHHQLRAYLTIRKVREEANSDLQIINYPPTNSSWFDKIESSRHPQNLPRRFWFIFSECYRILKYRLKGDL
jgi:uncharacterized SAM-binding protein YcdF (DUF218 family)